MVSLSSVYSVMPYSVEAPATSVPYLRWFPMSCKVTLSITDPLILPVDAGHVPHLVEGEVFVLGMLVCGQAVPFAIVGIRKAVKPIVGVHISFGGAVVCPCTAGDIAVVAGGGGVIVVIELPHEIARLNPSFLIL